MAKYNKSKNRILIVDDNLKNIQLVGKILRDQSFKVSVAQSGAEAIEIVTKNPPDLILLDILMPDMDGYETCKRLKDIEHIKNIPIIFLSALSETKNKVDGFKVGAVDYITKPIETEELLSRIDLHLTLKSLQDNLEEQVELQTEELLTANEALKKREEEYRSLMTAAPDPIIVYDLNLKPRYMNPAFTRIFGWNLNEMMDIKKNFIYEGEWEKTDEAVKIILKEGFISSFETKRNTKSGIVLDVSISGAAYKNDKGEVTGLIVNLRDISELKKAQSKIFESEKRYRLLAENVNDNIWILNISDYKFTYCSPSIERILGYTAEEIVELDIKKFLTCESLKKIDKLINSTRKNRNAPKRYNVIELEQIRKDGSLIWTEVTASFLWDQDEEPKSVLGVTRDITERKQLEIQLQQSQKMEAIGTLAGGIAHDFNNILSAVFGFAQLVKMKLKDDDDVVKNVDQIMAAGIRARDLVRHILTFSRQTDLKRGVVDIVPLIKESLKFIKATIPRSIEVIQNIKKSTMMVYADPTQIQQVAMNLMTNAVQSMKNDSGLLEVSIGHAAQNDFSNHDELKHEKYIRFVVRDTGCGIEEGDIERVFEPFFTTKSLSNGTGLGLSTVYGIIKDMEGIIKVESEPYKGTEFRVYFPEHKGKKDKGSITSGPALIRGKGRILLVDDEEPIVNWCRQLLNAIGYDVVAKTSSIEALEEFKNSKDKFDLVLTDLSMPEMSGIDLSKKINSIDKDIPVILCTGFNDGHSAESLKQYGIVSVLLKPMVASEFAEVIKEALN